MPRKAEAIMVSKPAYKQTHKDVVLMSNYFRLTGVLAWSSIVSIFAGITFDTALGQAQKTLGENVPPASGMFFVSKTNEQLQLVVNSSQVVVLGEDIDRASVHNDAVVTVRPMGRKELMISAKATGVTQVDLYAPNDKIYSVQVVVLGDARELEAILRSEFPMAALVVRPIQNAVIISGQVNADEHVEQAVAIAEQYYPTVINRIQVLGVHTIMLHTKVMEVSRTKLRSLGVDWALDGSNATFQQSVAGTLGVADATTGVRPVAGDNFRFAIFDSDTRFIASIKALQDRNLVKIMADPTVVAIDGRPASFNSGGEFPILIPQGLGQVGVSFREFGTRLDFVAKVRGDGRIWLEVRPTISEIDSARAVTISGTSVPGLRSRFVDTAVELQAGQTLALAGLLQSRTESQSSGIPGLCDLPFLGALFRSNREVQNEIELLITVTPDFAGAMDPSQVPPGGPGFNSYSPSDKELYWRGYIETPNPCPPEGCGPNGAIESEALPTPIPSGAQVIPNSGYSQNQSKKGTTSPAAYRVTNGNVNTTQPMR